jgi:hypothetical protein
MMHPDHWRELEGDAFTSKQHLADDRDCAVPLHEQSSGGAVSPFTTHTSSTIVISGITLPPESD